MPERLRILFIEDSESEFEFLKRTLRRGGLDVSAQRVTSITALERALTEHVWDLILSNAHLARITPMEALQLVDKRQLEIPFILVSDHIGEEKAVSLLKAGANDFVNFNNLSRLTPAIERELKEAKTRKEAEETKQALRRSENRYRQLVDDSPVPILLIQQNRIVYLNESARQTLNINQHDSLINQPVNNLFASGSTELLYSQLSSLEKHINQSFEATFQRADKKVIQVEVLASSVEHEGTPATQLVFTDITQRKESEAKLQQAVQIIEHTMEGVVITDNEGRITSVNPAFCEITGYTEAQIIHRHLDTLKADRHPQEFSDEVWAKIRQSGSWRGEVWNQRKNGEVYPAWMTISSVRDEHDSILHYVAVFSDITSIKQSQSQLEHLAHHDSLTNLPNP
jgi:PAS domain S-box-containing protein